MSLESSSQKKKKKKKKLLNQSSCERIMSSQNNEIHNLIIFGLRLGSSNILCYIIVVPTPSPQYIILRRMVTPLQI